MRLVNAFAQCIVIMTLLTFAPSLVSAQSTNAPPDLTKTDTPFDPAKVANLPDAAKTAVAQAIKQMKAGDLAGFVFAASPDGHEGLDIEGRAESGARFQSRRS